MSSFEFSVALQVLCLWLPENSSFRNDAVIKIWTWYHTCVVFRFAAVFLSFSSHSLLALAAWVVEMLESKSSNSKSESPSLPSDDFKSLKKSNKKTRVRVTKKLFVSLVKTYRDRDLRDHRELLHQDFRLPHFLRHHYNLASFRTNRTEV